MKHSISCGLALLGPVVALQAHAEIYMSAEAAAKKIFPQDVFERKDLALTADERAKIEGASGQKVRSESVQAWRSARKNVVFIDQVLGKHEYITYAVGIDAAGQIKGIEILEYRESYGQQVRGDEWRAQFVGKTASSPLKVGDDVLSISGASLSSAHVASGVKRMAQTFEVTHERL